MSSSEFKVFFEKATTKTPYPYQTLLAATSIESRLISVPTGCGKTAAVILSWLWQRRTNPNRTPRRLVYCLPMRTLVDQTQKNTRCWLNALGLPKQIGPYVLMGGEEIEDWDVHPERDAILIGTQDMLLSRSLNRGYGMSHNRWPMHFGLLNTDCLWIFDEIQLMGSGLATTAQLEALRVTAGGKGCHSWWMSATLNPTWLETVDFREQVKSLAENKITLRTADLKSKELRDGYEARKPVRRTKSLMGDCAELAMEIVEAHKNTKGRTLIVVNTVKRARELDNAVLKVLKKKKEPIEPILIHSQFRPQDRHTQVEHLLAEPSSEGTIIISTQVVEAGVDVSATTLFTEVAPWSSLVQRFGRCNRRGRENDAARVFAINLPSKTEEQEKLRYPYELKDLLTAKNLLCDLDDVGPKSLEGVPYQQVFEHMWVIRRKDFIDLFDTTPDLAGNDIDIDRYVREVEESDVRVFWREWDGEQPAAAMPRPNRDEICRVPIGEFHAFLEDSKRRALCYRWDYLDGCWTRVDRRSIYPGQIYLLHVSAGGYSADVGWNPELAGPVQPVPSKTVQEEEANDANDKDGLSEAEWQSIAEHTDKVCAELRLILSELSLDPREADALGIGARWHDRGKAHHVFQNEIDDGQSVELKGKIVQRRARPPEWRGNRFAAKAPGKKWKDRKVVYPGFWRAYERKHFRHELASALAVLMTQENQIAEDVRDLVAYLVAAHHGKVRLSIRSLPGELAPKDDRRFARGVRDDDELPPTDLGNGLTAPSVKLSLEPMELGLCEKAPFAGQPSWAERMLRLRDTIGPLRLAYLEALLRAADMRASNTNYLLETKNA